MLTESQFADLFPTLSPTLRKAYLPFLVAAMREFGIDTRLRAAAYLAQVGHESNDLRNLREIWGPTPAQARYDVRTDIGNTPERDGDGAKYKGRGGIQRTGKSNYRRAQKALDLPLLDHPELLEKPEHAFRSDALFWADNNLNNLADQLSGIGDARDLARFDRITRRINGGYNGRVDRQRRYLLALDVLPEGRFEVPSPVPVGERPMTGQVAPAAPTPAEAEKEPFLLDEIPINDTTKGFGKKAASMAFKASWMRSLAKVVGAALVAGQVWAWAAVFVLIVGICVTIYFERSNIKRAARYVIRRFGGA